MLSRWFAAGWDLPAGRVPPVTNDVTLPTSRAPSVRYFILVELNVVCDAVTVVSVAAQGVGHVLPVNRPDGLGRLFEEVHGEECLMGRPFPGDE